jgi:phosphopantothenoylcysteine decarboxylase / phosphopantothenate---cysteine ligase
MARIVLGISGSVAAYKACDLLRLLVRGGHDVFPVTTPGAERFVARQTFLALARREDDHDPYPHLARADLLVIAPLSANTLAKIAHGLADNVLTEAALAHRGPYLVAPAMNNRMWEHEATQANAALLRARGVELIGPEAGELAEGGHGTGRMTEPAAIMRRVEALIGSSGSSLAGMRVLVTAGGTREPLDAVRFVGNRSSGRMGVALAAEARDRGAEVVLLGAHLTVPTPAGVEVVSTPTAADLEREALARQDADVVLMAAAVADYRPADSTDGKRAKSQAAWTVELVPTRDVARALGDAKRDGQILVAFGAELGETGIDRKRHMLADKNADLVVFNDVGRSDIGFESDENEVVLIAHDGERRVSKAPKADIAVAILDEVERLLAAR